MASVQSAAWAANPTARNSATYGNVTLVCLQSMQAETVMAVIGITTGTVTVQQAPVSHTGTAANPDVNDPTSLSVCWQCGSVSCRRKSLGF